MLELRSGSERLRHLGVRNFRKFSEAAFRFDGRHVCLFGSNGVGKTSVLEALSLLAPGRGLRGGGFPQMIWRGAPEGSGWEVSVRFGEEASVQGVKLAARHGDRGRMRRHVQLDGVASNMSALGGRVRLLWMTPVHERVFAGSEGERRRFFDRLTLAHEPDHGRVWRVYEGAMRERNALFERSQYLDVSWLEALELRMAQAGASIACNRGSALKGLRCALQAGSVNGFPVAEISLEGFCAGASGRREDEAAMAEALAQELQKHRSRDRAAGRALSGVHRTNVLVRHKEKGMPADLCSSGEQKALLAGLVLAAARAFLGGDGVRLLLLDEAGARLDSERRAALCEALLNFEGQAFLTGTDCGWFDKFEDQAQRIELKEGMYTMEGEQEREGRR